MKVSHTEPEKDDGKVQLNELRIGQVGLDDETGAYWLRTGRSLIYLNHAAAYDVDQHSTRRVRVLPPGTVVTLTIE